MGHSKIQFIRIIVPTIVGCILQTLPSQAVEDPCANLCHKNCVEQVQQAEKELKSHRSVCNGGIATENAECAQTCSRGCKAFMRGQEQIIKDHFELCGGGKGDLGRLMCKQFGTKYKMINSHTSQNIGEDFRFESDCIDAYKTQSDKLVCSAIGNQYAVYSVFGDRISASTSFLYECDEMLMSQVGQNVCLKSTANTYSVFSVDTFEMLKGPFSFLSSCKSHLRD
jgi:hypothetical protein